GAKFECDLRPPALSCGHDAGHVRPGHPVDRANTGSASPAHIRPAVGPSTDDAPAFAVPSTRRSSWPPRTSALAIRASAPSCPREPRPEPFSPKEYGPTVICSTSTPTSTPSCTALNC